MSRKKLQIQGLDGPPAYENWIAAVQGKPSQGALEYPLFTDAHITGEIIEGYGPYQFINLVPISLRAGVVRAALILRLELHIESSAADMTKTDTERYHGGSLTDEIAALSSLALGIRLKAGDISREFEPLGDPRGRPRALAFRPDPVLLSGNYGLILPTVCGTHSLTALEPLIVLPKLAPSDAIALIRASRLYQDALWIAESEPSLAWVMLVSAVETAANHWRTANDTPVERLKVSKPELVELLETAGIEGLPAQVANYIADTVGATKKFVDFSMTFLPSPPLVRPEIWGQHAWESEAMRKTMRVIYNYRSKALHDGRPFPAPMCMPPYRHDTWKAPAEKPLSLAASTMGGTWLTRDTPMLLHTFEYIVRHSLLKWWKSMATA